jgi:hypothetical protein
MPEMASEIADRAKPATTQQISAKQFVLSALQVNIAQELRFHLRLEIAPPVHFPPAAPQAPLAQAVTLARLHRLADSVLQAVGLLVAHRIPAAVRAQVIHAATAQLDDGPRLVQQTLNVLL